MVGVWTENGWLERMVGHDRVRQDGLQMWLPLVGLGMGWATLSQRLSTFHDIT